MCKAIWVLLIFRNSFYKINVNNSILWCKHILSDVWANWLGRPWIVCKSGFHIHYFFDVLYRKLNSVKFYKSIYVLYLYINNFIWGEPTLLSIGLYCLFGSHDWLKKLGGLLSVVNWNLMEQQPGIFFEQLFHTLLFMNGLRWVTGEKSYYKPVQQTALQKIFVILGLGYTA